MTAAATTRGKRPQGRKPQAKKSDDKKQAIWSGITVLATAALTGLVTYCVNIQSAEHLARLNDRANSVSRFVESAESFNPLVVKFVQEVRSGEITQGTKDAIKANLLKQQSTLESASGISAGANELSNQYVSALVAADTGLEISTGPLDSRGFIQAAADIAAMRPEVITALRQQD